MILNMRAECCVKVTAPANGYDVVGQEVACTYRYSLECPRRAKLVSPARRGAIVIQHNRVKRCVIEITGIDIKGSVPMNRNPTQ